MKRIRVVAGRTALVAALTAVALTGCSALSPSTISTPYPPADGVGLALPGSNATLRNFLVVGTAKGAPAAVIGTVVNDGDSAVQVSLQTDLGATGQPTQTVITVDAHGSVQVGPDQAQKMEISDLAVPPGGFTAFSAATLGGGRAEVQVPVLLPEGIYASLTPAPAPSASATPSGSATSAPGKASKKKNAATATPTAAADTATPAATS